VVSGRSVERSEFRVPRSASRAWRLACSLAPKLFCFSKTTILRSVLRLNVLCLRCTPSGFRHFSPALVFAPPAGWLGNRGVPQRERTNRPARSAPLYPIANRPKNRTEKWRREAILRKSAKRTIVGERGPSLANTARCGRLTNRLFRQLSSLPLLSCQGPGRTTLAQTAVSA